ncbi:MAG: FAD-dependent oxidoreductase, partial [Lysobacteraceae bacterium]
MPLRRGATPMKIEPMADRIGQDAPLWLAEAIAQANIPTLACVLVQLTGDREWIEGRVTTRPTVVEMMSVSLGETIPASYAAMIRHELQLTEGQPAIDGAQDIAPPPGFRALIIGAGISGMCAAVQFAAAGIPYTILERRPDLGGVWFENRYPGAACDVPSHLYSFSYAPYEWSRYFAGSREIHAYLQDVADRFDIRRHIRFGLEVTEARWDADAGEWQADVIDADGNSETLTASMILSGVGAFNKPRLPDIPGMDRFEGPSVHTARYPEDGIELAGKKVVLVGNGASAMQVGPAIVDSVVSLTVVNRTPQWVAPFPKFKQAIPEALQHLMQTMPLYRLWYRLRLSWAFNDKQYEALRQDPDWDGQGKSINAVNDSHRRG